MFVNWKKIVMIVKQKLEFGESPIELAKNYGAVIKCLRPWKGTPLLMA
jgi:hypothetical protein